MRNFQLIFIILLVQVQLSTAQRLNEVVDSLGITISTMSYHPNGEVVISTGYNRENKAQYLLLLSDLDKPVAHVDTLPVNRPNRSAFSKDGRYLVYNTIDRLSGDQYTIKRRYYGNGKFGAPEYISEQLFLDNMYYYYMDEKENLYYYTFYRKERSRGGLLLSRFENGRYQKPEMIFPDRPNAVAFSPLLLDEQTMIFAQHGIKDRTTNGVYYSVKEGGIWKEPSRLDILPYCEVICYADDDTLALLQAKPEKVLFRSKKRIMEEIVRLEEGYD